MSFTDYIRIGTYNENGEEEIHLIKVNSGNNQVSLDLSYQSSMVRIDPDVLLIDIDREDNIWTLK